MKGRAVMRQWEIDFGTVACWDENSSTFHQYGMKLSYNSDDEYPCRIQTLFEDGTPQGCSVVKTLTIETLNENGLISISGDIFQLSPAQYSQLLGVKGKLVYEDNESPKRIDLNSWMPNQFSKDIGLIYCYVTDEDRFMAAHLWIGFEWASEQPIIFCATTFDDSRVSQYRVTSSSKELEFAYQGEIEGLHHYLVCGQNCLLTSSQVDILTSIINKLNQ